MEAKDLRIGNLVSYSVDDKIIEITGIEKDTMYGALITAKGEIGKFWLSGLKPIKLTEDWLVKMGFLKNPNWSNENYTYYEAVNTPNRLGLFYIMYGKNCLGHDMYFLGYPTESGTYSPGNGRFQYVHQLQNLYHALTGTELTV